MFRLLPLSQRNLSEDVDEFFGLLLAALSRQIL